MKKDTNRLPFCLKYIIFLPTPHLFLTIGYYSDNGKFIAFRDWDLEFSCINGRFTINRSSWFTHILPSIESWLNSRIVDNHGYASRVYTWGESIKMPMWVAISLLNLLKKYKITFPQKGLMHIEER